jgi:hypothetical protein
MTTLFDVDTPSMNEIRDDNNIPDWFNGFRYEVRWEDIENFEYVDTSNTSIVIEISYGREGDICYQIREYCVYDWYKVGQTGTAVLILWINKAELLEAEIFAARFFLKATAQAIGDYHDPTGSVAGGLVDIGVTVTGSALPPIFSDIAQGISMGQILDDMKAISDELKRRRADISRLRDLDGTEIARYENLTIWYHSTQQKTFSSIEIVEVDCEDWIQEIPDGETVRVPSHDEVIYPLPPLNEELERELEELRETYGQDERTSRLCVLKNIIATPYKIAAPIPTEQRKK